jgi:hypothetical protein
MPSSSLAQIKGANVSSIGINGLNKEIGAMPENPIIDLGCQTQEEIKDSL